MESWTVPAPAPLVRSGLAPQVRVHDTASGSLQPVGPREPTEPVRIYACGITPYDATHLGHAHTYVSLDILHRVLLDAGHSVRLVQNITDIDDPLFARARLTGEPWQHIVARESGLFAEDMAALRVLPPLAYVAASEAIEEVRALIAMLTDKAATYPLTGDLYFDLTADAALGEISHLSTPQMTALSAARGGDPGRVGKRDPRDPLLWQQSAADEPAWASPWGEGRPGWHVECAAIAAHYCGLPLDVQFGGRDLIYPHHEMSAGHARVAHGVPFARVFAHSAMVWFEGEKMSKSLGNLVLVSTLRATGVDPATIRLAILAHRWREDWEYTPEVLTHADRRRQRWAIPGHAMPATVLAEVRTCLWDDLDTPAALSVLDGAAAAGTDVRGVAATLLGVGL
ncbi:MAG: hypothetical protein KGP10_01230 [Actinomycetales bacterium]|nr:hypothetical protein [Actinomycetales bacterium]